MEMIPAELRNAALAARGRLVGLSQTAAAAGLESPGTGTTLQAAMAAAAREAIFADAVLGAVRARLEELRTVAK
jgi:hypothetical protein